MKVKLIIYCLFVLTLTTTWLVAQPEKVYSIVKKSMPPEWYKNQAKEWKEILDKNKANPEAWLNYYTASRMLKRMFPNVWQSSKENYLMDIDAIVTEIKSAIPNTFEYYYITVWNYGVYDKSRKELLFKALELGKDRVELYDDLVSYYETEGDKDKAKYYNTKWYDSNDISEGILSFNYNVLMSLEKKAILLTNGDNDTYPAWMLQQVKDVRRDVLVLNVNLLQIENYRNRIFSENSIKPLSQDSIENCKTFNEIIKKFIDHLILNSGNRPLYFALTLHPQFYEEIKDKLYLVGLALKYSEKDFNNSAVVINNYENNWLIDYLRASFHSDISSTIVKNLNQNYIPAFIKLYQTYNLSGELYKAEKVKNLLKIVLADVNKEDQLEQLLK